jgi:hypothetical protein
VSVVIAGRTRSRKCLLFFILAAEDVCSAMRWSSEDTETRLGYGSMFGRGTTSILAVKPPRGATVSHPFSSLYAGQHRAGGCSLPKAVIIRPACE